MIINDISISMKKSECQYMYIVDKLNLVFAGITGLQLQKDLMFSSCHRQFSNGRTHYDLGLCFSGRHT